LTSLPAPEELDKRRSTIEQCLREGWAPINDRGGKGSAVREAAKRLGINPTTLNSNCQEGNILPDWGLYEPPEVQSFRLEHPGKLDIEVYNGIVIVGSDAHYWPNVITTAHRALVRACKEFTPAAVIMNGDVLDGATISRHPPINWEERPSVEEEIAACQERLDEITLAAGGARRFWTLGNHDARFEAKLAAVAPEFAKVCGMHLHDHFPDYEPCWMVAINDDVIIKHRYKGGIHATHNNTLNAGKTIITGHLHSLKVTPFSDYNGTRFGVDSGTLAEAYTAPFEYTEVNPANWRSGFVVLTFYKGRLLWPEVVVKCDGDHVEFRGKVWRV
jgi:hypothetical protein